MVDAAAFAAGLAVMLAYGHAGAWPGAFGDLLSISLRIQDIAALAAVGGLGVMAFHGAGLYGEARGREWVDLARACGVASAVVAVTLVVPLSAGTGLVSRQDMLVLWGATVASIAIVRGARIGLAACVAPPSRRAVIVGSGPHALRICRHLARESSRAYRILGFVDVSGAAHSRFVARRTLGTLDALESILANAHVDEVHVGLPVKSCYLDIQETIRVCERLGVKVVYGADLFSTELARPRLNGASTVPQVELLVVHDGAATVAKRMIDIAGAAIVLLLLSPLLLATAAAVRLTSEGPIIFAQERYGLNRRRFRMLKFRTMVQDAERLQGALESENEAQGPVFKIARDPRITPLGRWLRRTSIDELPQLFNVLRGDMSLVGPRPLPVRDVLRFTRSSDLRRFSVRPGITGLWQVSGRSDIDFERWIALDLRYVDHWSLTLDLEILARTLPAVVRGTGAV